MFLEDRNSGKGGGALILVRNDIIAQESIDIIWENIETVVVQLKLGHHVMRLACIYRPPSADAGYNVKVRELIEKIGCLQNEQVVICGDFNFPQINCSNNTVHGGETTEQSLFLDTCQDAFLYQHVECFTRVRGSDQPSLLDLILTKDSLEVEDLQHRSPIGTSDHCVLAFNMRVEGDEPHPVARPRKNFFRGNYLEAARMFDAVKWDEEFLGKSVQAAWDVFMEHYDAVVKSCIPSYRNNCEGSKRKKKWMTTKAMEDIHSKEWAWNKYRKAKSKKWLNIYRMARNKVGT